MTPDHDGKIAKRAYCIWEGEGRPSGKELDHWLRAEAEVKAERPEPASELSVAAPRAERAAAVPAKTQRPAARRARRTQ